MVLACPSRPLALVLLLAACSSTPDGATTETTVGIDPSTGSTDAPSTGTASTEPTTGTTAPTTGDVTTDATTTDASTTTDATTTDASTTDATTTTTTGDTTTDGLVCDLVEITTEQAHAYGGDVLDCGIVDPWNNTVEEWQTAHTCALDAIAAEQQFQLVVWLQGIDSDVGRGYIGVAAREYTIEEIWFDTLGVPITSKADCTSLAPIDGCYDFLGSPCFSCEGLSNGETLCDLP
ncbi:hypothetical protein SAMN02745121_08261 [Nannocystis exedens]|uniref:Uncharacterized protein n=1 Tax=Nannocystis exedens TaxID=54 RepID=A0A1I2HVU2_9BACT|nr:hypothetical protein [Nannocystis exedens]PCC72009.1 hypothetical protein NAEX_05088 [Nannocystis exedens]SFF34089.1 hypothetical protein SAMN02745121_08261 [Nannocystis exedens]